MKTVSLSEGLVQFAHKKQVHGFDFFVFSTTKHVLQFLGTELKIKVLFSLGQQKNITNTFNLKYTLQIFGLSYEKKTYLQQFWYILFLLLQI